MNPGEPWAGSRDGEHLDAIRTQKGLQTANDRRHAMRFFDLFTIFFAQLLNFLFGLLGTSLGA